MVIHISEYPKLIGNFNFKNNLNKEIINTWRYKLRSRLFNEKRHILIKNNKINEKTSQNEKNLFIFKFLYLCVDSKFGKLVLLKDIINCQIISKVKQLRKIKKDSCDSLTLVGIRYNYPQDIINHIIKFTYFF